jgi:hypothetical protein
LISVRFRRTVFRRLLTVGPFLVDKPVAVASHPTINEISWIKAFVSRALAELDRSMESLAWRHGWVERCTFGGRDVDAMVKIVE